MDGVDGCGGWMQWMIDGVDGFSGWIDGVDG